MALVKFGDVVRRANTKEDRYNTERLYYVGGEHIECGEYRITKRGLIEGSTIGPMFYFGFKAGQILLASRSPDLRKAGMVTFDGICSEKTFVIETADESVLLQSYLPFIVRSNRFWEYANDNQSGSVNHFINWSTFSKYEFELPPVEEQARLSKILWAMVDLRDAYKRLLEETDNLVKSQFIEMFGSPVLLDERWPIMTIGDVASCQLGKMLNAKKQTGNYQKYYLANRNVQWFSLNLEDFRKMDFDEADQRKYSLQDGDLLVCEGGEIGRCAVWHSEIEDCYIQNAVHRVRCNIDLITPLFLGHILFYHAQENGFSDIIGSKSTIAHLPADKLKAMKIFVPPMDMQLHFVSLVEQADKSKFELKQAIENVTAMIDSLMPQG